MQPISLRAEFRESGKGAARQLRRTGLMPAVVYGPGKDALSIAVRARDLERALQVGGRNPLFSLELPPGDGPARTVVVKGVQRDPARRELLHIDFLEISLTHRITVRVPVVVEGSEGLEQENLLVQHQAREIEVECLPMEIPDHFTVAVDQRKAGDQVLVGDIPIPSGARLVSDPAEVVLSVVTARAAPVESPAAAAEEAGGEGESPADD